MALENLTDIIRTTAQRLSNHPAQRFWDGSAWVDRSYGQLWQTIQATARGLIALGVEPGERIGLMGRTRPEWVIADFAILLADAVTVPIYPSSPPYQVQLILEDAGIRWTIVDDGQMAQKLPAGSQILLLDAAAGYRALADLQVDGPDIRPSRSRADLATVVYTSGTTGAAKGVLLTHGNLLSNVEAILAVLSAHPAFEPGPEDVALAFLPLSHILERTGHNVLMACGTTLAYARSVDTLGEDLMAIGPTLMIAVPRIFEKIYGRITVTVGQLPRVKRWLVHMAIQKGQVRYHRQRQGMPVSRWLWWQTQFYDRLVFRSMRQAIGGRLKYVISGGATLAAELGEFFFIAGIPVFEGYGLTETSPVVAMNLPLVPEYGTVGRPLPGVQVQLGQDREILVRGPNVSPGYCNRPDDTAQAHRDGWFHTGDVGEWSQAGGLRIVGRKKNLVILSTGKNVARERVEARLATSPWIDQAVVVGDARKYLAALLHLNEDQVAAWAKDHRKTALDRPILLKDPELLADVMGDVARVTRDLAPFEQPKKVVLLSRALSEEAGELTPSLKVKVETVEERYRQDIDQLYEDGPELLLSADDAEPLFDKVMRPVVAVLAGILLALLIRLVTR